MVSKVLNVVYTNQWELMALPFQSVQVMVLKGFQPLLSTVILSWANVISGVKAHNLTTVWRRKPNRLFSCFVFTGGITHLWVDLDKLIGRFCLKWKCTESRKETNDIQNLQQNLQLSGSGHETAAVLLPGFAINW